MANGELNLANPRDLFQDNAMTMNVANPEKAAVTQIDVRSHFGQVNYGSSALSQNAIASMGLQNVLQPEEPAIEIKPQNDLAHKIEDAGMNLSEGHCKGFAHSKSDIGQLGASCAQAASELFGALTSKAPEMQPELSPHLAMAAPRPHMGGGLFG